MGKGYKGFRKHKVAQAPKAIRIHITFQESELIACKTEKALDELFEAKTAEVLNNFKVDVKKFFGFIKPEAPSAEVTENIARQIIEAKQNEGTKLILPGDSKEGI